MHAVSLDIKNAFNSLPRAEVVRALNEAGVPKVLIDYIRNFLDLRHSKDVKCEACGVPQGDPLSTLLSCMATERLLRRLKERGITFLAYADDIVALHDEGYPAGVITQQTMDLTIRSDNASPPWRARRRPSSTTRCPPLLQALPQRPSQVPRLP